MTEQTTAEISHRMTEDMRDTLKEAGFVAAETATPEQIHRKINRWYPGGTAQFIANHSD
jgi:hypothetical protein